VCSACRMLSMQCGVVCPPSGRSAQPFCNEAIAAVLSLEPNVQVLTGALTSEHKEKQRGARGAGGGGGCRVIYVAWKKHGKSVLEEGVVCGVRASVGAGRKI